MAIRIEAGKGDFSSLGGLYLFNSVITQCGLQRKLQAHMPTGKRITAAKSFNKFNAMVLGQIAGNHCIDDMDNVTRDPLFRNLCKNKIYTSQSYGDFLRSFDASQARKLNNALRDYAFKLRKLAYPKDHDLIIDIDSSSHVQHGKKMEGVEYNYASKFCLDSLQVYDQHGFKYHMDVRNGASHTAKGAHHVIRDIFKGAPRRLHRYMRGDSGYCNIEVMHACLENNVDFVIAMRANMYEPLLKKIDWWKWKPAKNTKMHDGRLCEIATAPYFPKGLKQNVRVVIIRAKKDQPSLIEGKYDYHAWVTNTGEHGMKAETVIDFYKGRGNAENFIKESKNGFDEHHFPCQSLLANKIYALITAFAYNTMRFISPVLKTKKISFSKRIRFRMIYLGAQVVKKSRYLVVRFNNHQLEEVKHWICRIQNLFVTG